eukprot:g234.t1
MNVRLVLLLFLSAFIADASEAVLPSNILLRLSTLSETKLNYSLTRNANSEDHEQLLMADSRWGPLHSKRQILVSLSEDFKTNTQEKVISKLKQVGGLFLSFIPQRTFLFLGDDAVYETASILEEVQWVGSFLPMYKIAPEWDPIINLLDTCSLSDLAENPVHALQEQSDSMDPSNSLFGHVYVEKRKGVERLVIEVHFPMFHQTKNGVDLALNASYYSPAPAAAVDWLSGLHRRFGDSIELKAFHGILEVYVPATLLTSVLHFLSLQHSVYRLQPKMKMKLHNWLASGIIQSGLAPSEEDGEIDPILHPIWSAGIQGEGQIVGCGDSGIDVDSCFFYDSEVSFLDGLRRIIQPRVIQVFESDTHRKIKYYHGSTDVLDSDGHGTHVAGTLVGNPVGTSYSKAIANRGMAPHAKIAFMDLGGPTSQSSNAAESDNSDSIYTPSELSTYYYPLTYDQGARIHSDSWGSDTALYDNLAREVDKFVWEHQDFLPVFAAGNYGRLASTYLTTVTSPAVAKNCISVGATLTSGQAIRRHYNNNIKAYGIEVRVSVSQDELEVQEYKILGATFGPDWSNFFTRSRQEDLELVLGSPETGCTDLNPRIQGKFVLLLRGECLFVQKLKNAQSSGALGVIVMNNLDNGYFEMQETSDTPNSELTIPMASVPSSIGQQLKNVLESHRRVTIVVKERSVAAHSYDNIAEFSSSGPTTDFRIKPDLVAPGRITSVWSDGKMSSDPGQCLLRTSSGTSMATPVVAGAAVLVRQYFVDGYYPTGQKNINDAYIPSAALMKATLLGGAFSMDGYTEAGLPLDPPPSTRQGFGRVHLESSIPLQGSEKWKEGWRIQVVDGADLATGQSHKYCVRALGGPIRITLVWTDPPASTSSKSSLVNDLDLSVKSAGLRGIELLGNGRKDRANNVERVLLDEMPEGNVAIVVEGHHIVAEYGLQPYALVVQGHFNGILQSQRNPYQSENQNTEELCIITLAVLESGPEGPVNNRDPSFVFTTQSGVNPVNGFECKLTDDEDQSTVTPLHDWETCMSPKQYQNLSDGAYIFTVRPKDEDVEVSRSFVVDTQAPVTEILPNPIPEISAAQSVEFQFFANDLTEVSYECNVEYQGDRRHRRRLRIVRESAGNSHVDVNTWYPCTSPQSFRGLTYGNWTFKVRGTDEAKNSQLVPTEYPWAIQFTPNVFYVRIKRAPLEVIPSSTLEFEFEVVTGDELGAPIVLLDQPTECRLFHENLIQNSVPQFVDCDLIMVYPNISDGSYVFEARTRDGRGHQTQSVASVNFRVDSTPPIITLIDKPEAYHGAKEVIIKFEANEPVSSYNCSMRRKDSPVGFIQCPGNEPGTVDYQLDDGEYAFQTIAMDRAGNTGLSDRLEFMIDTKAPQISFDPSESIASNDGSVSFEFKISDEGSGIVESNTSCSLLNELSQSMVSLTEPCVSPMVLELEEGRYLFTVETMDRAGHNQEQSLQIVIDFTPPIVSWWSKPEAGEIQPPFVVFQFSGSDEPKNISSSVDYFECKLQHSRQFERVERVEFEEHGKRRKLRNVHPDSINVRTLLETPESENQSSTSNSRRQRRESVRIIDGPLLHLDEWTRCKSPVVLTEIKTGDYGFQVRAVDFANNTGDPIVVQTFSVDDTLPIPGTETDSGDDLALSVEGIIAIVVALCLFILCVCILVACCRRKQRRKQNTPRQTNQGNPNQLIPSSNRRNSTPRCGLGEVGSSVSSTDAMLHPGTHTSLQDTTSHPTRLYPHVEHGDESQRIRQAIEESMEEYRYQEALKRSLNER